MCIRDRFFVVLPIVFTVPVDWRFANNKPFLLSLGPVVLLGATVNWSPFDGIPEIEKLMFPTVIVAPLVYVIGVPGGYVVLEAPLITVTGCVDGAMANVPGTPLV